MKKLLFPLMFLLGIFLFSACNEDDPRDNLPQFGDNHFSEWLKSGAEFIYATNTGDSILIRYDLVRSSSNVFQKTVIHFSAGDTIIYPKVLEELAENHLMSISYVQPGINNKKPSLWESNNIGMNPREEIYRFDENFMDGRKWTFTTERISQQDWTISTTPGLQSILNTRTIARTNWPVYIRNAKDSIIATIPCWQIDLTSQFSAENGGGSIINYSSFYVNQQIGLVSANEGGFVYTLARRAMNTVVLPMPVTPPPGGGGNGGGGGVVNPMLIGNWQMIEVRQLGNVYTEANPGDLYEACDFQGWEEFRSNGTMISTDACDNEVIEYTWILTNNTLILGAGFPILPNTVVSLTANELVLSTTITLLGEEVETTTIFRKIN